VLAVVPRPVTVRVPSKVNLHLAVGDLRKDGFHELTTVFQSLSLTDEVTVAVADEPGVEVQGEGATAVPTNGANLAWRAVEELARHVGRDVDELKVRVLIRKGIPVSGGMAGGSADAAATLVGLANLWKLEIGRDELAGLAANLGSDVPFMLHGGTALGTASWTASARRANHDAWVASSRCWRPWQPATRRGWRSCWATTSRQRRCPYDQGCGGPCARVSRPALWRVRCPALARRARSCVRTPTMLFAWRRSCRARACAELSGSSMARVTGGDDEPRSAPPQVHA
jgi:hypothetical protein